MGMHPYRMQVGGTYPVSTERHIPTECENNEQAAHVGGFAFGEVARYVVRHTVEIIFAGYKLLFIFVPSFKATC
jgi:hypothetical protein